MPVETITRGDTTVSRFRSDIPPAEAREVQPIGANIRDLAFLPAALRHRVDAANNDLAQARRLRADAATLAGKLRARLPDCNTEQSAMDLLTEVQRVAAMKMAAAAVESASAEMKAALAPAVEQAHHDEAAREMATAASIADTIRKQMASIGRAADAEQIITNDPDHVAAVRRAEALRHDGEILASQCCRDYEAARVAHLRYGAAALLRLPIE